MLLIGIDEAGYGPKLGPLCHGHCAVRCPDATAGAPDLWKMLHPAVTRHPARDGGIAVDDSKKLFSRARGLNPLVRGVGAFLECGHAEHELYLRLLPDADRARLEDDPWGRSLCGTGSLGRAPAPPVGCPCITGAATTLLRAALARNELEVVALGARAMSARHLNAALARGNKADVSWLTIAVQLKALAALARPGESVNVVIDRQGGRKFYAARLSDVFGGVLPVIETETARQSVYRIEGIGGTIRVAFLVAGDSQALPVALASMAAKLVRELCMQRLNAFFRAHDSRLKPTAGYATDARRFLADTQAVREKLGIETDALVRRK